MEGDRVACVECGYSTQDLGAFGAHIEQHEKEAEQWSHNDESLSPTSSPPVSEGGKTPPKSPVGSPLAAITPIITEALVTEVPSGKGTKTVHVCPHCNFTTYMSQHMKSHLEAHERHQGQMYQCDICQMQFSQKANMHRHRMRHSGVKPYECRFCKKRFFRKDQMQEHSMTHIKTGADFDCPVVGCTMLFSQHSALRAHLDETHSISVATPASCKRCSLLFANSRRLLLHYQTKHDDNDTSVIVKREREGTPKRKRGAPGAALQMPSLPTQIGTLPPGIPMTPQMAALQLTIENMKKELGMDKELSPNRNTDSSDHSTSPEYEQSTNYSMNHEDLLLCLTAGQTQTPFFLDPKTVSLQAEHAMRLWTTELQQQFSAAHTASSPAETHSPVESTARDEPMPAAAAAVAATPAPLPTSATTSAPALPASHAENTECNHCGVVFFDETLHLLHKGLHSENDPWRCNLCGLQCGDKYLFTTHIIASDHSA